jgi:hypothetical protein
VGHPSGGRPSERFGQPGRVGRPGGPAGRPPLGRGLAGLGVGPPVGHLFGPRLETVVELGQILDAGMLRLRDEPIPDIPAPTYSSTGIRRGRAGARCQPFDWSVSPTRPPNWTCVSPRIQLSTSQRSTTRPLLCSRWATVSGCSPPGSGSGLPRPSEGRKAPPRSP